MKIREGVDMGKAFETLKSDLIRADKTANGNAHGGLDHSAAYGQLAACVQFFLFQNSDAKTMAEIMQPEPDTLTSKTIEQ